MKEFLKKWWLVILGGIATAIAIALGRKPTWVRHIEKGIKEREETIGKIQLERDKLKDEADAIQGSLPDFEGMVKKQDEDIAEAGTVDRPDPITDPQSIADFIRDRGSRK